jgi:phosphonate transport system substrate-binding protein
MRIHMLERLWPLVIVLVLFLTESGAAGAADSGYNFGVLNQRSVALTTEYWNPILSYVSKRSGVSLQLKMKNTAVATTKATVDGEYAFVYTNHLFTPERDRLGYRVIARPDSPDIAALMVVREDSPYQSLSDLDGKTVVFPSPEAFVGYWVPMDAITKAGVKVKTTFGSNQEGAISQLRLGLVDAAAVNSKILESFSQREHFRYRVLWKSEAYHDMPIMANPSVPKATVQAVKNALIGMANDPEGRKVLEASAAVLKLPKAIGFKGADNADYENYRKFYLNAVVKEN